MDVKKAFFITHLAVFQMMRMNLLKFVFIKQENLEKFIQIFNGLKILKKIRLLEFPIFEQLQGEH